MTKSTAQLQQLPLSQANSLLNGRSLFGDNLFWYVSGFAKPGFPFEHSPGDYLDFAEIDLSQGQSRGAQNAFHNAKRAITCAIDSTLWRLGLEQLMRQSLPKKLDILNNLGIISPRIVRKVNQRRNQLEHDYASITIDEAEDAVDIAELFTRALEPFSTFQYESFSLEDGDSDIEGYLHWVFERDGKLIRECQTTSPIGFFFEAYRDLDIEPTIDKGVYQSWIDRADSTELRTRGYEEVTAGFIFPKTDGLFEIALRRMVMAILDR